MSNLIKFCVICLWALSILVEYSKCRNLGSRSTDQWQDVHTNAPYRGYSRGRTSSFRGYPFLRSSYTDDRNGPHHWEKRPRDSVYRRYTRRRPSPYPDDLYVDEVFEVFHIRNRPPSYYFSDEDIDLIIRCDYQPSLRECKKLHEPPMPDMTPTAEQPPVTTTEKPLPTWRDYDDDDDDDDYQYEQAERADYGHYDDYNQATYDNYY